MSKIKVGFIGVGRIADLHRAGYVNNLEAELYAVCGPIPEPTLARKREWGAEKHYTDYREMLADPDLDAVEILSPTDLHEEMAVKALEAGKHVALQKPMANTLESADRIIAAARKSGKICKVSDNYVWYPPMMRAKEMIGRGDIGTPTNIRIKLLSGSGGWLIPAAAWEWRLREARQGRGLQTFDHGHHLWATAWYLLGEIERVSAWIDHLDGVVDSPATIMWKYMDGIKYGMCEYCHEGELNIPSKYYANDEWIEVTGTRGLIVINRCTGNIKDGPSMQFFNGSWHDINLLDDWVEGFKGNTRNFINSILGREEPYITAGQGRYILKIALAIQKSNRLHREVYLDEMDAAFPNHCARKMHAALVKANRPHRRNLLERLGIGGDTAAYAPRAKKLTEDLIEQYDPDALGGWETVIGIDLLAEGDVQPMKFTVTVKDGRAILSDGLPDDAVFTVTVSAGLWAAILLKKKRVEMAFMQGKLKIQGKSEEVLKLRAAFKM